MERNQMQQMNDFEIQNKTRDSIEILELKGELDAHTASELEKAIQEMIALKKYRIVVSFKNLEYISSAGLGVFMAYIEEVRSLGGDIKLTNMSPKVFNVFDLLGFPTLYDILEDEDDAFEQFKESL
ncbi:MAG: STAS domain-containing protein [Balneolales bacterium]